MAIHEWVLSGGTVGHNTTGTAEVSRDSAKSDRTGAPDTHLLICKILVEETPTRCRRTIAKRILPRHETLKEEYSQVGCGLYDGDGSHPLFLLRDILKNPEIVWYVKDMFIEYCNDSFGDGDKEDWEKAQQIAVECKDGIIKAVQDCPYLDDEEREHWIEATLSCHQNTAVALLACMLPCVEYICITDYNPTEELHRLARKIDQANRLDPGGSHALSKLGLVREKGYEAEVFQSMKLFEPLCGLPSMRHYIGRYLYQEAAWTPLEEKSTITTLELKDCMIHLAALRSAFRSIANLREFTYEYYWAYGGPRSEFRSQGWERDWRPEQIIRSLLEFAGHSLIELDLTRNGSTEMQRAKEAHRFVKSGWIGMEEDEDDEDVGRVKLFMGSLRDFQVLKYIRVQNEAFVDEFSQGFATYRIVHRLVDLLPASVVNITLAMPQLCEKESCRLIEGLPELKAERVPNLEKIIVESGKPYKPYKPYKQMKTVLEADGIELIL